MKTFTSSEQLIINSARAKKLAGTELTADEQKLWTAFNDKVTAAMGAATLVATGAALAACAFLF